MKPLFIFRLILVLCLCCSGKMLHAYGASDSLRNAIPAATDTPAYIQCLNTISASLVAGGAAEQALLDIGNAYACKCNRQKALSSFIRSLKLKSGNNPADAGQSVRVGKMEHLDK